MVTIDQGALDADVSAVAAAADQWARTPIVDRVGVLRGLRGRVGDVAEEWATLAARSKLIPGDSPLVGEEWLAGPFGVIAMIDGLIETLDALESGTHLDDLRSRSLPNGQVAVTVLPRSRWDRILFSGVSAEVWMLPGVSADDARNDAASAYRTDPKSRSGRVSVVLGAGNINSIAPLDCLHKLFSEHSVVVLKLNPVNEYLAPILDRAFEPLIERDALRIVTGDAAVGEYLVTHHAVHELHITGSEATHDVIVWGVGEEAERNKRARTPRNVRPITSELGAVCPTIVVPGPWDELDLRFHAEHIATQKLHNNGYDCVACQVLVLPAGWEHTPTLLSGVEDQIRTAPDRGMYYPGTAGRLDGFCAGNTDSHDLALTGASTRRIVSHLDVTSAVFDTEVFGPALGVVELDGENAEEYLRSAIGFANSRLRGTLGANVLIHPATIAELDDRFESLLIELRYGCIAVNGWSAMGFGITGVPWGAFPGHTLDDVGSGIGFVHNALMLSDVERSVVTAPFRPAPGRLRRLLPGAKPPWFVTHRRAREMGELATRFQLDSRPTKLPKLISNALRG